MISYVTAIFVVAVVLFLITDSVAYFSDKKSEESFTGNNLCDGCPLHSKKSDDCNKHDCGL